MQLTFWSIPPLIAALVTVGAYLQINDKGDIPGIRGFRLLLACVLLWCAAEFVSAVVTELEVKTVANRLMYCAIAITPIAWFAFAIGFARRQVRLPKVLLNAVSVLPAITILLVVSNDQHGLIWRSMGLVRDGNHLGLTSTYGSWFYLHAAYCYTLIIAATSVLAFSLSQFQRNLRASLAVIAAPVIIGIANLFSLSDFNPKPWLDLTTLGFAAAVLVLNNGVLKAGILDSVPVIRDRVVEQLSDGVVVIDHQGHIIDLNVSAMQILGLEELREEPVQITDLVTTMPLSRLNDRQRNNVEVTLGDRAFDVTATRLDASDPEPDQVLVFRDVTLRREQERELRSVKTELEQLAHTDGLTALFNRRYFMQRLQQEIERVRRHGSVLSVLVFDLDHFKSINDTYGHEAGDRVLIAVARVANDIKRITDLAARIGGEEFALLLPETSQDGAAQLAARLRHAIEAARPLVNGTPLAVTASVGVATVTHNSRDIDGVLNRADSALYRAKRAGRNKVCWADEI